MSADTATLAIVNPTPITVQVIAPSVTTLLVLANSSTLCSVLIVIGAVVTHHASPDTKNLGRDPEPVYV